MKDSGVPFGNYAAASDGQQREDLKSLFRAYITEMLSEF